MRGGGGNSYRANCHPILLHSRQAVHVSGNRQDLSVELPDRRGQTPTRKGRSRQCNDTLSSLEDDNASFRGSGHQQDFCNGGK